MKKRLLTLSLALIIAFGAFGITALADSKTAASPTASTVSVDGTVIAFEAYNIGGSNYFKLRDLALTLSGTEKQFEVGYDNENKVITLTSGDPYTAVGGEMAKGTAGKKSASPSTSMMFFDDKMLGLEAYNIGGNNFFKLRDLMMVLDVYVGYDNATKAITLDTSKGYIAEGASLTAVEARAVLQDWLDEHSEMSHYDLDQYFCSMFNHDGTDYYRLHQVQTYYFDFMVNTKTGELFCRQTTDGEFPDDPIFETLDDYYDSLYGAKG